MRIIAIVNQKGGCGKTTTAINLAAVLAEAGWRTLLVDLDPQSHCAAGLSVPESRIERQIGDAMFAADTPSPIWPRSTPLATPSSMPPTSPADPAPEGELPFDPARLLWRIARNLDLAPSTMRLAALEAVRGDLAGRPDAEWRLARALARWTNDYDVCLIDCSPSIGLLTYNALAAAHEVLIPVETGYFSFQGATKQVKTITSLGRRLGVTPPHRFLPTLHDPASDLARDLLNELIRRFPGKVIPTVIRHDASLREAASFGQPVIEYAPGSPGAADYTALGAWLTGAWRGGAHAATRSVQAVANDEPERSFAHDADEPSPAWAGRGAPRSPASLAVPDLLDRTHARPAPPTPPPPPAPTWEATLGARRDTGVVRTEPSSIDHALDALMAAPGSRAADVAARARRFHERQWTQRPAPEVAPAPEPIAAHPAAPLPPPRTPDRPLG